MAEIDDGGWVRYEDYAASESKLDSFRKEVRHVLFHWDQCLPDDALQRLHDLAGDYSDADAEPPK